nr:hypothetical protein [Solobacterium sp.]
IGSFSFGAPSHFYELWKNGKKVLSLSCQLKEDGSTDPAGEKEFYRRVELYMDRNSKTEQNRN